MGGRVLAVVIVVCMGGAASAAAQQNIPVVVNERVRVWTDAADATVGRVMTVPAGTMQLTVEGRDPITIAAPAIRRVEVSRGTTSRGAGFRKGAIRGAIILAAIGAVSGALQHDQVGEDGATVTEAALLGVWSGGLFGGLIGGAIGAARAGDRWEQVWP